MKIDYSPNFLLKLEMQVDFIARDKPSAARAFKNGVLNACKSIAENPLRCRKSIHYNDESIRDLIYKGYTIIYKTGGDAIKVFALTKYEDYDESPKL